MNCLVWFTCALLSLPLGGIDWSVFCDCGISFSYSLGFGAFICIIHNQQRLTLKALITTAADDKFCDIIPNFSTKIRYDIT